MKKLISNSVFIFVVFVGAQEQSDALPFKEMQPYAKEFTSSNVLARLIDGLGYRYYWATQDISKNDLTYKISDDARDMNETLKHIYEISTMMANSPKNIINVQPFNHPNFSLSELRKETLANFKQAHDLIKDKDGNQIEKLTIMFQMGDQKLELSYWNMINGPISDAIYHVGQIVAFRRAIGNPINPKVNVLMGKNAE